MSAEKQQSKIMRTVTISTSLPDSTTSVWQKVGSMQGVNDELYPWLGMSFPRNDSGFRFDTCEVGAPVFTSTIRLFRFIPYDRHCLRFTRIVPGEGFLEESTSWMMHLWIHERSLVGTSRGTHIEDRVSFEPRFQLFGWLAEILVTALFKHRHRRLRERFGKVK